MPGIQELLIIGLIIFFIFGAKRIPEFLGGLGAGIRDLKKGLRESEDTDE